SHGARLFLDVSALECARLFWIGEKCDGGRLGEKFAEQFHSLWSKDVPDGGRPSNVAAGPIEAGDEAERYRVVAKRKNDGNDTSAGSLGRLRGVLAHRRDDCYALVDKLRCQSRQSVVLAIRDAVLERYILAFDKADFFQTLLEPSQERCRRRRI